MVVFPNIKVNLGLNIVSKRNDGYHNLESVFLPIPWTDILEITPSKETTIITTGRTIEGNTNNNLCAKAIRLMERNFDVPNLRLHLHKILPSGAGLGGGSSDGAHTLLLINSLFALNASEEQLIQMAAELGADCPFFIKNKPQYVTGIGEIMEDIAVDLKGKYMAIVFPEILVSTAIAFQGISPRPAKYNTKDILANTSIEQWKEYICNDFEAPVFKTHPIIKEVKSTLYKKGALFASMSGTGSAVYGIFSEKPDLSGLDNYLTKTVALP